MDLRDRRRPEGAQVPPDQLLDGPTSGVAGGYRLEAGAELPPLLLADEEAVAVAVGLHAATTGTVAGIEETAARALAKLEQVLPARLRHRVNALRAATVSVPPDIRGPTVSAKTLTMVAAACRDHDRLASTTSATTASRPADSSNPTGW